LQARADALARGSFWAFAPAFPRAKRNRAIRSLAGALFRFRTAAQRKTARPVTQA